MPVMPMVVVILKMQSRELGCQHEDKQDKLHRDHDDTE